MKSTENFTNKADAYEKYRPSYPNEYIDYLVSSTMVNEDSIVADIGSGTGKLSRQLLEKGLKVIAVEPNDEMRMKADQTLKQNAQFISIKATAENTSLNHNSVDLITVGQAFHWFDKEKFRFECERILKQDAKVALVWNSRDISSELTRESEYICRNMCSEFKGFSGGIGDTPDVYKSFFRDGKYDFESYQNDLELDYEGFMGRYISASYSPKKTDKEYVGFISALTDLFKNYSNSGKILFPNITRSYLGKV